MSTQATTAAQEPRRSVWDWTVLIAWKCFCLLALGIVYWAMVSEGLRYLVGPLGLKIYKIPVPGLSLLANEVSLRKIDLAHCFSIMLLVATYTVMNENLRIVLRQNYSPGPGWNPKVYVKLTQALGATLVGADAILFYVAMAQMSGWGGVRFSFTTLLATVLYISVLVFVSMVTVFLERKGK